MIDLEKIEREARRVHEGGWRPPLADEALELIAHVKDLGEQIAGMQVAEDDPAYVAQRTLADNVVLRARVRELEANQSRLANLEAYVEADQAFGKLFAQRCDRAEACAAVLLRTMELIAGGSEFQDAQGERNCIAAARAVIATIDPAATALTERLKAAKVVCDAAKEVIRFTEPEWRDDVDRGDADIALSDALAVWHRLAPEEKS